MLCARCRNQNPDGARFCNQCGEPVAAPAPPEFRRLTVLFCDLVGSVALSSRLDPEDWHRLLASYQETVAAVVRQQQGHIAQHLGDGLVAYFGYPQAQEDDALRAVRAALHIVEAVGQVPVRPGDAPLSVRIGLHTGAALMSDVGSGRQREHLATGDTPNIASRLQSFAAPGCVVASQATQRAVRAPVRWQDLGEQRLKGLPAPLRVFQALALPQDEENDEVGDSATPPLLGRARELELLATRWSEVARGAARGVLVLGEPGIGKSRLTRELRLRVAGEGRLVWLMRCAALRANTPFAPLTQLLQRAVPPAGAAAPEARAAALATALQVLGCNDEATRAPLAALLDIEQAADTATPPLSAQALRERTFAAATTLARAAARQGPTLLVVEDLHWADPTTLEWLGRLVAGGLEPGSLLLLTARTEFVPAWSAERVEPLLLEPCSAQEAAALVRRLDRAQVLSDEAVARIVARAEGNPLFLEEFTRSALETGDEDIPASLQDQTLARLDRLGPAKAVLQQAAVIGRRFALPRLRAACQLPEAELAGALQRGVDARLLTPVDEDQGQGGVYAFRHALLQDAAYASMLRSVRQACHQRVAEAIRSEDRAAADRQPELLAHHYAEAGQTELALQHWLRAGQLALSRSACQEAAAHVQRALALLGAVRRDEAALALELELQLVLAPALMTVHGVLDERVEQAYSTARRLCERIGNTPKMLVPLWGLWAYELVRGQVDAARAIAARLADLARGTPQPMPSLVAAATTGMTLFYQGQLVAAREAFATGIALYQAPRHASRSVRGVHDPGVMCHAFDMLACWLLGDAAAARAGVARLREMAPVLAPFDAAFLWCADALHAALCRDAAAAGEAARRAIALAREQAFPAWQMMGTVLLGWAQAAQGPAAPGIDRLTRGLEAWDATGSRNLRPLFLALLADAWLGAGRADLALQAAQDGLAASATGERVWLPELHRLRGLALAGSGQPGAARAGLQEAITTAGDMGAAAWQARAEASLSTLQHDEGSNA